MVPDAPSGGITILVVEDDEGVREVIIGILSDLGYRTLVARTGPEALELLEREKGIDLLFTDVIMPGGISGVELARTARRLQPALKIGDFRVYPRRTRHGGGAAGVPVSRQALSPAAAWPEA